MPMIEKTLSNNHHEIRDAIRDLCKAFPDEYFRKVDEERAYPEKFVNALTEAGWLAALILAAVVAAGVAGVASRSVCACASIAPRVASSMPSKS